ncbi:MAG: restriction endonuclease [Oscillibacter sp.]|nr:restriction endonuclease [Oscillibacter sp.]
MDTNKTTKLWAAHSLGDAFTPDDGAIAFDWPDMGDLSALPPDREAFRQKFDAAYPDANAANRTAVAGALYRLAHEMEAGDYIACLHGDTVSLGTVSGPYAFRDNAHTRPVNWLRHVQQSQFSRDAMREITYSPVRLFPVKRFAGEFLAVLGVEWLEPPTTRPASSLTDSASGGAASAPVSTAASRVGATASGIGAATASRVSAASASARIGAATNSVTGSASGGASRTCAFRNAGEVPADTLKFTLDAIRAGLTRETFRQFAAGLLRAMGYAISAPPDGGLNEYELTASRDELFPPVLVQLRAGEIKETDVLRLKAALAPGSYGLVMTPYSLSDRARRALRDAPYLRAVDGEKLAALTLKYYCDLDERYRAMVPLRMVYVPAV